MKRYIPLIAMAALTFGSVAYADSEAIEPTAIWTANCKKCHADDGSGSTKIGQKFGVRDYTDAAVQASFTDAEIIKITKEGVLDENGKKKMPPYADKLTDEEIAALVPLIRSFQK